MLLRHPPSTTAAAAAASLPLLQVVHRYVKQRKQFGRHPHFQDKGSEVRRVAGAARTSAVPQHGASGLGRWPPYAHTYAAAPPPHWTAAAVAGPAAQ